MIRFAALCILLALPTLGWCQEPISIKSAPLSLDKALELALQNNLKVKNAELDVEKAGDDLAAARTKRLPSLHLSVFESHNLTKESYEFEEGVFGTFPGIGPIPAQNTEIETNPGLTTVVSATLDQPRFQCFGLE